MWRPRVFGTRNVCNGVASKCCSSSRDVDQCFVLALHFSLRCHAQAFCGIETAKNYYICAQYVPEHNMVLLL